MFLRVTSPIEFYVITLRNDSYNIFPFFLEKNCLQMSMVSIWSRSVRILRTYVYVTAISFTSYSQLRIYVVAVTVNFNWLL